MTTAPETPARIPETAPAGADEPLELVPLDSLTAEMVGHWTYLMMEGAAFAMQGLHPVIREVTDRYSVAKTDPGGRALRSVDSVLRWTYGGLEAIQDGRRLRSLHAPLTMKSSEGKQISALNPGAYQWVIATAYVTTAKAGPLLMGREFGDDELEELLRDNIRLARILQVPMKGYPRTRAEFDDYYEHMVTEVLSADEEVREQYRQLRTGDLDRFRAMGSPAGAITRRLARPLLRFNYLSIVGLLDPRLRDLIGVDWTPADQRSLERAYAVIRLAYRILPDRLTYFPIAYHARKHHQQIRKMRNRELKSAAYTVRPRQDTPRDPVTVIPG
ncbi:oxygenase MpaB family protein [Nocardia sp. NPDC024068]|uniref:oxygenase MpaB family protein n=1 Tax=Nocardia sp. NPDC024068 TaxID=3157197 RepID=UPI0033C61E41